MAIDVTQKNVYRLRATPCDTFINWFTFSVTGQIDGKARISIDGMGLSEITGKVANAYGFDWFYSNCPVRYEPQGVTTGALELHWEFR